MTIGIYISTILSLVALDSIWLFSTSTFYKGMLSHLFAPSVSFGPAVVFYLLYAFGLIYFVISPALQNHTGVIKVLLTGALFGVIAYATYDLTNQATLKDWPMLITLLDMLWGAVLTGAVSTFMYWIFNKA